MRLRRVKVSSAVIAYTAIKGNYFHVIVNDGVPKDAKLRNINYDYMLDCFHLIFEHPSFDDLEDGDPIPEQEVLLENIGLNENGPTKI